MYVYDTCAHIDIYTCVCVGKTRNQIEREGGDQRGGGKRDEEEWNTNCGGKRTSSTRGWNVRGRGQTEG